MTRFAAHLEALGRRLPLAPPVRNRVLMEVAADLEDLFEHFRSAGLDEPEAARRAAETCDLSDMALGELVQIHSCGTSRLQDRVAARRLAWWEHALLAVLSVAVLAGTFLMPPAGTVIAAAGLFIWPVLGLFAAVPVLAAGILRSGARAVVGRSHRTILHLAGWQLAAGALGVWTELYRAALGTRGEVRAAGLFLVDWLQVAAALMMLTLACALVSFGVWYELAARAARLEATAAANLLPLDEPHQPRRVP